jgi:hypothetical protein
MKKIVIDALYNSGQRLLEEFLKSEIRDLLYVKNREEVFKVRDTSIGILNETGNDYLAFLLKKIQDAIKEYKQFDFIQIVSLTNLGNVSRKLSLYNIRDPYFVPSEPGIIIQLCPCGKKNHWGKYGQIKKCYGDRFPKQLIEEEF